MRKPALLAVLAALLLASPAPTPAAAHHTPRHSIGTAVHRSRRLAQWELDRAGRSLAVALVCRDLACLPRLHP